MILLLDTYIHACVRAFVRLLVRFFSPSGTCCRGGRAEGLTFDHAMAGHSFDLNISALDAGADETWPNVTMVSTCTTFYFAG